MLRGAVKRAVRLIGRSVAMPKQVAGWSVPVGLIIQGLYLVGILGSGNTEKVLRFALPMEGPVPPVEMTFPQVLLTVLVVLTFVGGLIGNAVSEVGRLEERLAPRLSVAFDPADKNCRQMYDPDRECRYPHEIIRIRVDNLSEATTVDRVRVWIRDPVPDDGIFERREQLEVMGGTGAEGRSIDPGAPIYAQLLYVMFPDRRLPPQVQVDYKARRGFTSLQKRLSAARWHLTVHVTSRSSRPVGRRVRIAIPDSPGRQVEIAHVDSDRESIRRSGSN